MNATAVERITPPQTESTRDARRILPPSIGAFVKWGPFALLGSASFLPLCWALSKNGFGCGSSTTFAQLERVVAATGNKVVMEPTLDEALGSLFGTAPRGSGPLARKQAGAQAALSKAMRDQAEAATCGGAKKRSTRSSSCWQTRRISFKS